MDNRRLNRVSVKDTFPLPRIRDTLSALAGALADPQFFSSIDLAADYHQIKLRKEDRTKTAFVTPFEHCQYIRCPMDITNSPATSRVLWNIYFVIIFLLQCWYNWMTCYYFLKVRRNFQKN